MNPGKTRIIGENHLRLFDLSGKLCLTESLPFFKKGIVKSVPSLRFNDFFNSPYIRIHVNYTDNNNCKGLNFFIRNFKNK